MPNVKVPPLELGKAHPQSHQSHAGGLNSSLVLKSPFLVSKLLNTTLRKHGLRWNFGCLNMVPRVSGDYFLESQSAEWDAGL